MSVPRETVEQRKAMPLATGLLDYFPDALLVVAEVSRIGNEQHHPGAPLHWDKSKSTDEADALLRHLVDRGTIDTDGVRHSGKVAWRALALLQRELDAEAADAATAPAPGLPDPEPVVVGIDPTSPGASGTGHPSGAPLLDAYFARLSREMASVSGLQDLLTIQPGITEEPWGDGDGDVSDSRDLALVARVSSRGVWPPDTRVAGLLTCCGQSDHPIDCPQWRA